MAPAFVDHLPNEIHAEILKHLLSLSTQPKPMHDTSESPDPPRSVEFRWIDADISSPSLFPFNAASVCKLWYNILIRIPECWTRVAFDVTRDPTPFLDVFLWSDNLEKLAVYVFSTEFATNVDHACEARRVAAIAQALQPHVHRCESIYFDVNYSSSLPPPTIFFLREAPHLESLMLECDIDDIARRTDVWTNPTGPDEHPLATSFPRFEKLSLTGFWFMYLVLHKPKWFQQVQGNQTGSLALMITRFTFLDRGFFVLETFVDHLSKIDLNSLSLSNLSLSYNHENSRQLGAHVYDISCQDIYFEAVSKDFLVHLYSLADITTYDGQSFRGCEIPHICQVQSSTDLNLENLIDSDGQTGRSLRNILEVWSGMNLTISSCPSFNDTFLSWFGTQVEYNNFTHVPLEGDTSLHYHQRLSSTRRSFRTFPSDIMSELSIMNCPNFTSHAMREFIDARNNAAQTADDDPSVIEKAAVSSLSVTGRGPMLGDEDADYEDTWEDMIVFWRVKAPKKKTVREELDTSLQSNAPDTNSAQ